jgi:hypothetical protein
MGNRARSRKWFANRRDEVLSQDHMLLRYGKPNWVLIEDDLRLFSWREAFCEEDLSFQFREVEFEVLVGTQRIAFATFTEWKLATGHYFDIENWKEVADGNSLGDLNVAKFLERNWSDEDDHPFEFGNIAILDRLVIHQRSAIAWSLIKRAITKEFKRRCAMLVLEVFPLEWESQGESAPFMGQRIPAMKRLYERVLGMSSVPGETSNFMWAPLKKHCPSPIEEWMGQD